MTKGSKKAVKSGAPKYPGTHNTNINYFFEKVKSKKYGGKDGEIIRRKKILEFFKENLPEEINDNIYKLVRRYLIEIYKESGLDFHPDFSHLVVNSLMNFNPYGLIKGYYISQAFYHKTSEGLYFLMMINIWVSEDGKLIVPVMDVKLYANALTIKKPVYIKKTEVTEEELEAIREEAVPYPFEVMSKMIEIYDLECFVRDGLFLKNAVKSCRAVYPWLFDKRTDLFIKSRKLCNTLGTLLFSKHSWFDSCNNGNGSIDYIELDKQLSGSKK